MDGMGIMGKQVSSTTATDENFIRIVDVFNILAHENPKQKASLPQAWAD